MRLLASLLIVALLSSGPAFAAVDANGDGKIMLDELIGYKLAAAPLTQHDRDSNGFLDPQELAPKASFAKNAKRRQKGWRGLLGEYLDQTPDHPRRAS